MKTNNPKCSWSLTAFFFFFYLQANSQSPASFSIPEAQKIQLLEDNKTLLINTSASYVFFSNPDNKFIKQIDLLHYSNGNHSIEKQNDVFSILWPGFSSTLKDQCLFNITDIQTKKNQCITGSPKPFTHVFKNQKGDKWYAVDYDGYLLKYSVEDFEVKNEEYLEGFMGNVITMKKTFSGKMVILTKDGNMILFDPENGVVLKSIKFSERKFDFYNYSYSEINLSTSTRNNYMLLFDKSKYSIVNSETLEKIREHKYKPVTENYPERVVLKFSNDGLFYAIGQPMTGQIDIYRTLSGIKIKSFNNRSGYLDFEITPALKEIILLTHQNVVMKLPFDFIGDTPNSLFWNKIYSNNKYAYVLNHNYDLNQVEFNTSIKKRAPANHLFGTDILTSSNLNELIGVGQSSLIRLNFITIPVSKKETVFKINHEGDDPILGYNESLNRVLFFYPKSNYFKLYDLKSHNSIDSLKWQQRLRLDKVIGSQSSQAFYLFGHKLVMKYQQGAEPEVIIKDTDYKHLKDDFGRNLILVFKENFEIFDLDQNKIIHVLDKSLYSHLREPNYIEISFSSNMKMAIFTHYRNTTKYLVDISKNEIIQSFEDPRILQIKFKTDSDLFLIYNNRIQSTRIN